MLELELRLAANGKKCSERFRGRVKQVLGPSYGMFSTRVFQNYLLCYTDKSASSLIKMYRNDNQMYVAGEKMEEVESTP